jgi:probable HAF family extracellular repeat protein
MKPDPSVASAHTGSRRLARLCALGASIFLSAGVTIGAAAEFQALDMNRALSVSADGSVVVGTQFNDAANTDNAVVWRNGVITKLGTLGGKRSTAYGVSADGRVVVGAADGPQSEFFAFRWTGGTMVSLGVIPESKGFASAAFAASADGSVIVGNSQGAIAGRQPFRWVKSRGMDAGTMISLDAKDGSKGTARSTNADGSIVVGQVLVTGGQFDEVAFRWVGGQRTLLGTLGGRSSNASATNADGSVVVGFSKNQRGRQEAFRWVNGVMTGLGHMSPGDSEFNGSTANAVSADGNIVIGNSFGGRAEDAHVFRWTPTEGMQSVRLMLEAAGVRLTDWQLGSVTGVSADGRVLVGHGQDSAGDDRAWRVILDPPRAQPKR